MQQELIKKKREIINIFLKKGVLISSELLRELDDYGHVSKIFDILKTKKINDVAVAGKELNKLINQTTPQPTDNTTTQQIEKQTQENKVKIIYSYKEESKKRDSQDFVDYFNNRYRGLERILKQHQELKNTVSINKIINKKEKEATTIIGIVSKKQLTKNGNLLLLLEDPSGQRRVLVNKNKPRLFSEATSIVLDEVIGVVGVNVDTIIFANNIVWPDVPTNKEFKKSNEEKYALFLSDLHVGSSKFLPDDFSKFIKWINGEIGNEQQKHISKNVDYIFIAGDLVDGCGIYPEQDKELTIKDIYQQYEECAKLLKQIPNHIPLIICPGNHDALRIAEPQPPLSNDFAKPLNEMDNVIMVSNPSLVNINSSDDFLGFDVLMYHGYSFDYFAAQVDSLRNQGGYDRADLIMKFLLKRRHLAPTHTSTLYIPDTKKDPLLIERIPDFFLSGHIHKSITANYRNTTLICGSCWQGKTSFQEKVGHNPEPSRVPIVNLQTRDVKILKFGK
jgi:DNA polymerase II small subunit|tara:strand:- start:11846 stop:13360 length:1515 start_codon:yes stop_codon:yes gene_type:complete